MSIRVLSSSDVDAVVSIEDCIEAIDAAMRQYSARSVVMPVRLTTKVPGLGDHLCMPAALPDAPALGMKTITIYPDNPKRNAPILQGLVVVNDYDTGTPLAVIDAARLTGLRTAAASAVATRALAREDAKRLAIIGSGVQAGSHLEAMLAVRPIEEVVVCSRTRASAERFVDARSSLDGVRFRVVDEPREAIEGADIVCAVSSSRTPVMALEQLAPGVHINGVGSHGPKDREVDGPTMAAARVLVDSRESALRECGDCILAIADGLFGEEHVTDEVGDVLNGTKPGRTSDDQITVYQSCGLAVQDVAVATLAFDRAAAAGRGVVVDLK